MHPSDGPSDGTSSDNPCANPTAPAEFQDPSVHQVYLPDPADQRSQQEDGSGGGSGFGWRHIDNAVSAPPPASSSSGTKSNTSTSSSSSGSETSSSSSMDEGSSSSAASTATFSAVFSQVIINTNSPALGCVQCHSNISTASDLVKQGWVVAGNAAASPMYIEIMNGAMPRPVGNKLSQTQQDLVRDWINGGAQDN